jgi:branched-chain amino acid transport system permease protein
MQEFIIVEILNSLAYAMLLFVLALGLSLTFGLLRFVNLAHGSFFLVGGYVGATVIQYSNSFLLGVLAGGAAAAAIGILLEFVVLRHFYRRSDLDQVILSFGCALILGDLVKIWWGKDVRGITLVGPLGETISFFGIQFPLFRLLIVAAGLGLFVMVWLIVERTRLGALVRASVDDRVMVGGLGFDVKFLYAGIFAFGTLLAGFGGVIGAPVTGLYPGLDLEILITTLVVVVVGGLGSISGAFWSSLLIGAVETFGKTFIPQTASFLVLVLMAVVLVWRSIGKFEEEIV